MTDAELPPEEPFPSEQGPAEAGDDAEESLADRARGTGVGVEDPNIVGDVGPTDTPPGRDPDRTP